MNFQKWRRDNFLDLSKLAHKSQAQKVKELSCTIWSSRKLSISVLTCIQTGRWSEQAFDGSGLVAGKEFLVKQGHALRGVVTCFLKVES
jgi:hypothetical protein